MSRVRTLLATIAMTAGAAIYLSASAHAVCIPNNFAANWLQLQENAGGHTIARHVGRTDNQLMARLQNQGLNAVGSYPSAGAPYPAAAAQATITAGLAVNRAAINNWANGAGANATTSFPTPPGGAVCP
jgi:Bacterial CdiA-CT RNAse A domain